MWAIGEAYEAYVGRWSRPVATSFLSRLKVRPGSAWLDVGCGTGALTEAIMTAVSPGRVVGVDPSEGFLATARVRVPAAEFVPGDAQALPLPDNAFDAVVSGLAINFCPDPRMAVAEMVRVASPGAVVAGYVWDYFEGMQLIRYFWDAAKEIDPAAVDEAERFPICRPEGLRQLWIDAGLARSFVG